MMKEIDEIHLTGQQLEDLCEKSLNTKYERTKCIALDTFCVYAKGETADTHKTVTNIFRYSWDWINQVLKTEVIDPYDNEVICVITKKVVKRDDGGFHFLSEYKTDYPSMEKHITRETAFGLKLYDVVSELFFSVNLYLCSVECPEKAFVKTSKVCSDVVDNNRKSKQKKRNKKPKLYIKNEYRLIREYASVKMHKPHSFSCPAWGVRGHYRHYKDGRVIFIKPYTKGTKKEEYRSKEYVLEV